MLFRLAPVFLLLVLVFGFVLPLKAGRKTKLVLIALMLLGTQQLFICRFLFGGITSPELPSFVLALMGWAFISLFFLGLLVLFQIPFLFAKKMAAYRKKVENPPFSPGRRQALLAVAAAIPAGYATLQAKSVPAVRSMEVTLPRLPKNLNGLSLVQVSDLHASAFLQGNWVRAIVKKVNALQPDLILLTGDIVDGIPRLRANDVAPLVDLRARHGVFGCPGNHEYYSGFTAWTKAFSNLGITLLKNSHISLSVRGQDLVVAGVTDIVAKNYGLPMPSVSKAFSGAPEKATRILLDHRPNNAQHNANAGVDLQLSGHTHGGQILVLNRLVARFNQGYLYGWHTVDNMRMYVSSGAGLWSGFPARLGVPAEIAHMVLRSPAANG